MASEGKLLLEGKNSNVIVASADQVESDSETDIETDDQPVDYFLRLRLGSFENEFAKYLRRFRLMLN